MVGNIASAKEHTKKANKALIQTAKSKESNNNNQYCNIFLLMANFALLRMIICIVALVICIFALVLII